MARNMIVSVTDDLDGSPAVETVDFMWCGVTYEIDLNEDNSRAFDAAMAPYVQAARRIAGRRRAPRKVADEFPGQPAGTAAAAAGKPAPETPAATTRKATAKAAKKAAKKAVNKAAATQPGSSLISGQAAIREWAVRNGHQIANRGRIPRAIVEAYQADTARSGDAPPALRVVSGRAAAKRGPGRPAAKKAVKKTAAATKAAAKKTGPQAPAKKTAAKKAAPSKAAAAQDVAADSVPVVTATAAADQGDSVSA